MKEIAARRGISERQSSLLSSSGTTHAEGRRQTQVKDDTRVGPVRSVARGSQGEEFRAKLEQECQKLEKLCDRAPPWTAASRGSV